LNIDEDKIVIGTFAGLYFYKYNIINGKIDVIDVKRTHAFSTVYGICYFKNKIIFIDFQYTYVYNLEDNRFFICLVVDVFIIEI